MTATGQILVAIDSVYAELRSTLHVAACDTGLADYVYRLALTCQGHQHEGSV